jgi:hypothetical protein
MLKGRLRATSTFSRWHGARELAVARDVELDGDRMGGGAAVGPCRTGHARQALMTRRSTKGLNAVDHPGELLSTRLE